MKIDTVNVIEVENDDFQSIISFAEGAEGNIEAEADFKTKAIEHGATEDEMEVFLEDGYYESGTYQLFLSHSG